MLGSHGSVIPTLADSNYVLVEFLPSVTAAKVEEAIRYMDNYSG